MIPRLPEIDAPATPYLAFLSALRAAGFEVFVTETDATTEPKGTVIRQNPSAGTTRPEGDSITIEVSTFEPEPTPSPTPTVPTPDPTETPSVPPTPEESAG